MTSFRTTWGRAAGAALLAGAMVTGCDWLNVDQRDPNRVPSATLDQLFLATQVATYYFAEGEVPRLTTIWIQQLAGTDRQYSLYDTYVFGEGDSDNQYVTVYTAAGLPALRQAQQLATEAGRRVYLGILKIHEAYLVGMSASIWGDIVYSQAANPSQYPTPQLDRQEQVYAAVQQLLDGAIADLQSGQGTGPGPADLNFGGDPQRWIRVANSLKARFYMHWVEAQRAGGAAAQAAQVACGGDCIAKAIQAAQNGINTAAGDWRAIHGEKDTETNVWYQFMRDRSGYVSAGAFLVNTLQSRNDPRLNFYFQPGAAGMVGSRPGENRVGAAQLNIGPGGVAAPAAAIPILTCAETQFILAEAYYYQGNVVAANNALQAGIACERQRTGLNIPAPGPLVGQALFDEILLQKYIALFLNLEAWNDYKRTCRPALQTYQGQPIPRRFYYGSTERQSNPNVPPPAQQPRANRNDPNPC